VSCGLRDVLSFEGMDTPAVLVASRAFRQAAEHQSRALGQPKIHRVLVAHPIQDRSDKELQQLARGAVEAIVAELSD
jgi:hypothetical protein